jgi:undecaprenyl-diphosphatase
LGARIVTDGLKLLMARPRPADLTDPDKLLAAATSASFPSGHTTSAVYVFGFLILVMLGSNAPPLIKRGSVALLVLLIAAVASSRLFLGVHYPSDILGGALSGGIMLALVHRARKPR